MTAPVFYSLSPYGTGDIKVAADISISGGIATLTEAQTGNIGVGCDIEYNSLHAYIAPNRIGFDSGGTTVLEPGAKIEDATSGATGIIRYVEVTSGSWAGGDAAGWIYFESTTGTFGDNNQINCTKPTTVSDIATANGTIQGNIGNGNTEFVVKTATGGTPANQDSVAVTSIHHEWASLADYEAHFTDSSHINNASLVAADVVAFACCYYDHDNQTADTTAVVIDFGTPEVDNYLQIYTPIGETESINSQGHSGAWDIGKYRLEVTGNHAIENLEDYTQIVGLQIYQDPTDHDQNGIYNNGPTEVTIKQNIIKGNKNNTDYRQRGIYCNNQSGDNIYVLNNILYDFIRNYSYGIFLNTGYPTFWVYNNTVYNCYIGIHNEGLDGPSYVKNNIATSSSSADFNGTYDSDSHYNISSDDTAPGTNSKINQTLSDIAFVSTTSGSEDLHIQSASTAKDAGTDLSSDTNLSIWRDIDGDERGASWDIGADEYVSSGQTASLSDTFNLSETLTPRASYKASLSDSLNLSETPQAIGQYKRALSDNLNFTESLSPIGHFLRALSDGLSMSDALSVLAGYKASTSDTLNLSDSTTVTASYKSSLTDTITLTDNFSALLRALASLSDILNLTDSLTYPAGQTASLSDTLSLSDSVSAKAALLAAISDVFTLSDTTSALANLKAILSDTFNLSDQLIAGLMGNLVDTLTLSDSATGVGHFLTTLADTLTLTDVASGTIHFKVNLSDTLTFSDQVSALAKYAAAIIDTLNLTDEISGISVTITGELTITFSSSKPTMVFSSSKSTVGITSSKPTITIS